MMKFAQRVAELGLPRKADTFERGTMAELKSAIADFRAAMIRFLWIQGVGIVGLTVALVKLLPC
jgi:hypothetical protein